MNYFLMNAADKVCFTSLKAKTIKNNYLINCELIKTFKNTLLPRGL